jgi:3-hydroxyacyl-CoA dehydrogenase, NAD binding domain
VHTEDVRRVLVIGSGTMGLQIGLQSATHGYDVVLYDASADALAAGPATPSLLRRRSNAAGLIDAGDLERSLARATMHANPAQPPSGSADDDRTDHPRVNAAVILIGAGGCELHLPCGSGQERGIAQGRRGSEGDRVLH